MNVAAGTEQRSLRPAPLVIAHRGFVPPGSGNTRSVREASAAPAITENTEAAMAAALAAGADVLESDCRLTRDGEVVLFHDPQVRDVNGRPHRVAALTLDDLRAHCADRGGVLTLADALLRFPAARFNIDVKAEAAAHPAGRILGRHADRVLITSFSDTTRVAALRAAAETAGSGELPATSPGKTALMRILGALLSRRDASVSAALDGGLGRWRAGAPAVRFRALQIPERSGPIPVLSRTLIAAAHAHGVEIHVWTINDRPSMERLLVSGVDGLVTDRTDLARSLIAPH